MQVDLHFPIFGGINSSIQYVTSNGVSHITGGNFVQGSITINGWLRDFLWAQASQVIVRI